MRARLHINPMAAEQAIPGPPEPGFPRRPAASPLRGEGASAPQGGAYFGRFIWQEVGVLDT